jgi:hypothetical protein
MIRDRDIIDILIMWAFGPLFARLHRRRIERQVLADSSSNSYREWRTMNPGRCMYCAYTRWANEEKGQSLKVEIHRCVEGNGPAHPLPVARLRTP